MGNGVVKGETPGAAELRNSTDDSRNDNLSESPMERMKKILTSPSSKKKSVVTSRYFGIALEELTTREGGTVPKLVQKICSFIEQNGLHQEGIFRINGNARVVERLKTAYERNGDADLREAGDMMAVAGVLKLFLRELPDGIVPERATKQFVITQEEYCKDATESLRRLKALIQKLPAPNQSLLHYLCRFLVRVTSQEETNKMSPMALGIVFGPNIFRCSGGVDGLRMQGTTNQITLQLITRYDEFFSQDGRNGSSPQQAGTPPPRPPPPRPGAGGVEVRVPGGGLTTQPVPSPRKSKLPRNGSTLSEDSVSGLSDVTSGGNDASDSTTTPRTPSTAHTPRGISDDEFHLDSDRSEAGSSVRMSPMTALVNNEVVEKAINSAITQHLFGENSLSSFSYDEASDAHTPIPAPRKKRRERADDGDSEDEERLTVKERVQRLTEQEHSVEGNNQQTLDHRKQRPSSQAFQLFEDKGIIIGVGSNGKIPSQKDGEESMEYEESGNKNQNARSAVSVELRPTPKPRQRPHGFHEEDDMAETALISNDTLHDSDDSGFGTVQRNSTLSMFKKAPGPKNRRMPSRKNLRYQMDENSRNKSDPTLNHSAGYEPDLVVPSMQSKGKSQGDLVEDLNHNETRPSISFLDIHQNHSPNRSPSQQRKPYVPPLDLSILHEHGDGSDPIPVKHGSSISIQKSQPVNHDQSILLSPRTSSLSNKSIAHTDYSVPPSPPTEQPQFTNSGRSDDDPTVQTKVLTKKIQSCKRKIKIFEENFEEENGYRPSQSDKASQLEIKKCMQELAKARKELRKLKSEMNAAKEDMESPSDGYTLDTLMSTAPTTITTSTSAHKNFSTDSPKNQETLHLLLQRLVEKRTDAGRPDDLFMMTREEVQDEKLDVQKALLQYESLHGRPTSKSEKELMKPLYDRYRTIKRVIAKPSSPRDKCNLESVPEDHTIEFSSPASSAKTSNTDSVRIPTSDRDVGCSLDSEFLVTRDMGLLRDTTLRPLDHNAQNSTDLSPDANTEARTKESNLHELSVPELLTEQTRARTDKKKLRKVLREFEDDFFNRTGRKVQKEDRSPREAEYQEYKQVKARLKLLEALLSKYDPINEY